MTMNWTSPADAQSGDASDSSEYLIKADLFTTSRNSWSGHRLRFFTAGFQPIVIGVLGTDPFGNVLDRIVEEQENRAAGICGEADTSGERT